MKIQTAKQSDFTVFLKCQDCYFILYYYIIYLQLFQLGGHEKMHKYSKELITRINQNITEGFPHLFPITSDMKKTFEGVSRLVMLDRYTQKHWQKETL